MNTYQCVVMNIVSTYKPFCLHHLIILEDFFLWTILKTQTNLKRGTARSSLSLCDMAHEMLPRNKTPVHLELPVHLKNRSNASIAHDLSKRPFQIQGVFSSMLITQQRSVSVTASQRWTHRTMDPDDDQCMTALSTGAQWFFSKTDPYRAHQ